MRRSIPVPVLAVAVMTAALAGPAAAQAQDPPLLTPERLALYVEVHLAITEVRDTIQLRLAEPQYKTAEGQRMLRDTLRVQIQQVLDSRNMTMDEYQQITLVVSTDAAQRRAFERLAYPDQPVEEEEEEDSGPVMVHVNHVLVAFRNTPAGEGLLPIALAEAAIAVQHAALAARAPDNLDAMKLHAGHILHAVDPAEADAGPGRGYGVKKAAEAIITHIGLAAGAEGASQGVTTHAEHVTASARNTLQRADRMIELAKQIQAAESAAAAAALIEELNELAKQLTAGVDADGDGAVSWQEGEGGLEQVEQHTGLMARAAG